MSGRVGNCLPELRRLPTTTGSPDLYPLPLEVKDMILITVLCRFSLLIVKYFLKHIEQRHSLCFDRAWLPLSNEWATAMSAKGTNDFWTKMDSPVLRLSVGGERFGFRGLSIFVQEIPSGWRYCLVVGKALAKSARCPQETLTLLFG